MTSRYWQSLLLAALLGLHGSAFAQAWPSKQLRIVVPFTAGSATDTVARIVSEKLSLQFGQPVIVENRPGAGGTVGAAAVAKSDPDGYTILVNSSSHTVTASTYTNLPYDTARDFAAVTPLTNLPNVLVVSAGKDYAKLADLVAAAKAKPGTINYASAGEGSAAHLSAERFRMSAGFQAVHIPFKGAPEAMGRIVAGEVDFYFVPISPALPLLKAGKLRALAIGSSRRASALPELATTLEAGYANSDYNFWLGMFVPARTPRDVVTRLYRETLKALELPDVKERIARLGGEPMAMTPEQFDAYVREEIVSNAALVKAAGIKAN
jgi:tripartite-type tricarboxylate transporter receptor subunit TctC